MNRVVMPTLDMDRRKNSFAEVALGYDEESAKEEAQRCLNCANPRCVKGCPVNIAIPQFIEALKNNQMAEAYRIITASSSLPAVCGRVCPQEHQCEAMCVQGLKGDAIAIGALERYVADYALAHDLRLQPLITKIAKKVAIIGAGPSGLSCALELAQAGVDVTVYEALHKGGGVLTYGIPEFRLPKHIVEAEIKHLEDVGIKFIYNAIIGQSITLEELQNQYDAIYLATGAGLPKFMGIPNEDANGVFSANEILTRINLMGAYHKNSKTPIKIGHQVLVIGGGNVALDAARSLKRLGSAVTIVYRRSKEEMPARQIEIKHAEEEDIAFQLLTNPLAIEVDDNFAVTGLKVERMELTEVGEDGRRGIKNIPHSEMIIPCDMIVMAIGTNPNPTTYRDSLIKTSKEGLVIVDNSQTSVPNIFAGGDITSGSATVILAMEAGKKAAKQIVSNWQNSN